MDEIGKIKTQVELLKQTDVNIVSGLNDIKALLKDMHNDNRSFQEKTHDRVTRLEYDSSDMQKKISEVQVTVSLTNDKVGKINTTITKFKAWTLGWGAGAGITGGVFTGVVFKIMGYLH